MLRREVRRATLASYMRLSPPASSCFLDHADFFFAAGRTFFAWLKHRGGGIDGSRIKKKDQK